MTFFFYFRLSFIRVIMVLLTFTAYNYMQVRRTLVD